jgi:hypothetical protein
MASLNAAPLIVAAEKSSPTTELPLIASAIAPLLPPTIKPPCVLIVPVGPVVTTFVPLT